MKGESRELVYKTLAGENPRRAPRHLWVLPWAEIHHPAALKKIRKDFPDDIVFAPASLREIPATKGDFYKKGEYIDEWGTRFENLTDGIIGEVKQPQLESLEEMRNLVTPEALKSVDIEAVNAFCKTSDRFVLCDAALPRPFERIQWLRGTENVFMDLALNPELLKELIQLVHRFYMDLLEIWCRTDVDGIWFMDDWGSQNSLLISPDMWREFFKPCYKDYIDIIHHHGKKAFFHSDGYILDIYPDLIELGLDSLNSQIFCMGMEKLKPYRGQITFWGEIDRQHLLPHGTPKEVKEAVEAVYDNLWDQGGCIAQCEFGPAANPDNICTVFDHWDTLSRR